MYEGCVAEIRMLRNILEDGEYDDRSYICEITEFNEEEEKIHLLLREGGLKDLSLDGIYECVIKDKDVNLYCEGMIGERFIDTKGKNLTFFLENGFYKNSLN